MSLIRMPLTFQASPEYPLQGTKFIQVRFSYLWVLPYNKLGVFLGIAEIHIIGIVFSIINLLEKLVHVVGILISLSCRPP